MTAIDAELRAEMGGPGTDWFGSIVLLPREGIDYGNVVTQSDERFDLFSAYRADVSLASIANNAPASVEVVDEPTVPLTVQPFTSVRDPASVSLAPLGLILRALAIEPSSFDSTIDFGFDVQALSLAFSGVFVTFLTGESDLGGGIGSGGGGAGGGGGGGGSGDEIIETLSWSTDIIDKASGQNEQRIARRENPRQYFDTRLVLDGADRRRWANTMFGRQSAPFAVPLWHERLLLSAAVIVSATTATFTSTAYCDLRVGGLCVLYKSATVYDVLEVESVTSTLVTFTSATGNAYAIGDYLMPVRVAYVDPVIRSTRPPWAVEKVQVRYTVIDNDTGALTGDTSAYSTNAGRVLLDGCNVMYSNEIPLTMQTRILSIDNDTGSVSRVDYWDRSKHGFPIGISVRTRADLWKVRRLLISLRGQQASFWIPTFFEDLLPTQTLTISTNTMDVANDGYTAYVGSRQPRATFRITFTDGTTLIRRILSSVELSATEERLTIDAVWPATKTAAQVTRVEFLELVRFDTDDIEIRHREIGMATIQIPAKVVVEA